MVKKHACKCKRKMGAGKRKIRKKVYRRKRGGALSDWIPSVNTVASYVPGYSTAKGYYDAANDLYSTGKELHHTYETKLKPTLDLINQYSSPLISTPQSNPGPPPPPPNSDFRSKITKEMSRKNPFLIPPPPGAVNDTFFDPPGPNPLIKDTLLGKAIKLGQRYKPISLIDNALQKFGQRDRVRKYLNDQGLGFINNSADSAIQAGFGHQKRKRKRGGNAIRVA